ncbi:hypothetical protein ACROYT_G018495 [Oculina patagonica]
MFHQECERLKVTFSRLCYPEELVQSTIRQFIESKVSEGAPTQQNDLEKQDPIRIVLPFKDQKSANSVRRQLGDLSRKIKVDISPVYTSRKIKDEIKVREDKPPLVNQQCVVYNFQCNLCDAGYVGYTCRHLHQRIEEHKGSAIGTHLKGQHDMAPDDIAQFFRILKKCQSKAKSELHNSASEEAMDHTQDTRSLAEVIIHTAILAATILLSLTGNSLVCLAFCRNRRLRPVTNFYVLSLAVADIMAATFEFPFGTVASGLRRWPFGYEFWSMALSDNTTGPSSLLYNMLQTTKEQYVHKR